MAKQITVENFKDHVSYKDGVLFRNSSGKALGTKHHTGYLVAQVNKKQYLLHRLVWLYFHGKFPEKNVDHINGDKQDNRIENLRLADYSQNGGNRKASKNNLTGLKGVHVQKTGFVAMIMKDGKNRYLGMFKSAVEAKAAYDKAAKELFGEFARTESANTRAEMRLS